MENPLLEGLAANKQFSLSDSLEKDYEDLLEWSAKNIREDGLTYNELTMLGYKESDAKLVDGRYFFL